MLRTVMAEVVDTAFRIGPAADIDPGMRLPMVWQQPASPDFQLGLEVRRAVDTLMLHRLTAPAVRDGEAGQQAECGDAHQAGVDDLKGCLGVLRPWRLLPFDP